MPTASHDRLGKLYAVADDADRDMLVRLQLKAGLLWVCTGPHPARGGGNYAAMVRTAFDGGGADAISAAFDQPQPPATGGREVTNQSGHPCMVCGKHEVKFIDPAILAAMTPEERAKAVHDAMAPPQTFTIRARAEITEHWRYIGPEELTEELATECLLDNTDVEFISDEVTGEEERDFDSVELD